MSNHDELLNQSEKADEKLKKARIQLKAEIYEEELDDWAKQLKEQPKPKKAKPGPQ